MKKLIVLLMTLLMVPVVFGQDYEPPVSLLDCSTPESGDDCRGFQIIDMNGDGLLDIVTSHGIANVQELKVWYHKPVLPSLGLIAHWGFDDASNLGKDSNDNHHQGINTGVTQTTGIIGSAASFDGSTALIQVPAHVDLEPTDALTVSLWAKFSQTNNPDGILIDSSHGGDKKGWVMGYNGTSGVLSFSYGNQVTWHTAIPTSDVADDVWHQITGLFDGSTINIYVDGDLEHTVTYSGTASPSGRDINIGAWTEGGSLARYFNGLIDDIRLYNRAITDQEICALAQKDWDETTSQCY